MFLQYCVTVLLDSWILWDSKLTPYCSSQFELPFLLLATCSDLNKKCPLRLRHWTFCPQQVVLLGRFKWHSFVRESTFLGMGFESTQSCYISSLLSLLCTFFFFFFGRCELLAPFSFHWACCLQPCSPIGMDSYTPANVSWNKTLSPLSCLGHGVLS